MQLCVIILVYSEYYVILNTHVSTTSYFELKL